MSQGLWSEPVGPFAFGKELRKILLSTSCTNFIRGREKDKQKAVVKVSATSTKQKTVVIEQESVQAEKEDTTQLYIGINIIVKGLSWVGESRVGISC
jgi:hypothetical protein